MPKQTTNHLLLIRPANFGRASETVADNSFQSTVGSKTFDEIGEAALAEFDQFASHLRAAGLKLTVLEDTPVPVKPDAVFCNNWFSTHEDGLLITYPCYWPQRRNERRTDLLELLDRDHRISRTLDLTHWEEDERYLESTGCLLLDRVNSIAYACISQRCTQQAVYDWCEAMDYKPITFHGTDLRGETIYHTNVMMAIGTESVIVCLDAVTDPAEKAILTDSLTLSGRQIVGLSLEQVDQFAGNALEVATPDGPLWIMSSSAFNALDAAQREALLRPEGMRILHADLTTIEKYGGGSARCMVGEIFLPGK